MINILSIKPNKDISFNLYRYKSNLFSCVIFGLVDFFICFSIILLDHFGLITLNYTPWLIILCIYLAIWLSAYIIFYCYGNRSCIKSNRIFFILYLYPTYILHTLMSITNRQLLIGLGTYPIFVLSNCSFLLLTTFESILLYLPLALIFILHLTLKWSHGIFFIVLLGNVVLTNFIAFIYSIMKAASFKKIYNTHMMLIDTIHDRDEANEKLRIHEKYITDFFINISHDLKAPLNIIYSSEQLLEKQILNKEIDFPRAEKYITSIKLNSIRLTRLLNNVLDVSKIDAAKFSLNLRNLDIVTTLEGITDSLVDFMESKNITLSFDTDFEEMILALDEEKLERIVLNLLSNALKFTPAGGEIFIQLYEDENSVFVSIKDTGIGIDEETQKNIFDRFVQGSTCPTNDMSGSGIGLSLVKSLMVLHGGDVFLESKVGAGSNFILKFEKNNISETLAEDMSTGSIYPNNNASSAAHLEFAGLVKEQLKNNTSA